MAPKAQKAEGVRRETYDQMRMQAWISARLACESDTAEGALQWADEVVREFEKKFAGRRDPCSDAEGARPTTRCETMITDLDMSIGMTDTPALSRVEDLIRHLDYSSYEIIDYLMRLPRFHSMLYKVISAGLLQIARTMAPDETTNEHFVLAELAKRRLVLREPSRADYNAFAIAECEHCGGKWLFNSKAVEPDVLEGGCMVTECAESDSERPLEFRRPTKIELQVLSPDETVATWIVNE
jgi:hypothetical protein